MLLGAPGEPKADVVLPVGRAVSETDPKPGGFASKCCFNPKGGTVFAEAAAGPGTHDRPVSPALHLHKQRL